MKVLMLSIDSSIFTDGSEAQERMKEYGAIVDELHIVLYTEQGFSEKKIAENVWIYPTNTVAKPLYFFDAYKIGKKILCERILGESSLRGVPPDASGGTTRQSIKSGKNRDCFASLAMTKDKLSDFCQSWVITSQDSLTNIVAVFLKKKFGIPFQAQIHTDFLSPFFKSESWKNYIRYLIYCWSIKKADCIRVVSERIKKSIVSRFRINDSKISVSPIFVDAERIKNQQPTINLHEKYHGYDFTILMASRITKEKRIDLACEAIIRVFKYFSKIQLVIVGDGPLKNELKKKYEKALPWQHIVFEDAVSYDTLISYYKTADLFLVTSAYEGYGRTIIEALAAGLPVFSADVGVAREMIKDGETGVIFKSHNSKEIASRIIEVLLGNKFGEMKLKTREFAKNFSMPSKEEYLQKMKDGFEKCQ